ncbi:MAG: peptidylprolyl isomerase [Aminobacterium sp.]|jgi:peptidylprolyl isomerase|uniref:FKBP-type peptidyl-prolyl cis-trans isomerase n=1 Tax=unclassified Aminobacterium TaxID=2685012 RepID=UPI001BCDF9F5|nr:MULTISPECIES: peptidylprolyl isomerase [unclassified Aminobacterium]MDD2206706.1 peptidylprolyl isomerase [Aminobacterium sp.]MDD3425298.1 peptidylprolyl isomerase [Aminobacterium sp.]MDD3706875.1 peptidylprolyl isomerase [Aminobacterium sp.]MDD4228868.1 peptidylprolyl isomerase [Aminobacterium sp.]MDD4551065.1 peptidylprolyl isomerase [Aminobacterium sp.]
MVQIKEGNTVSVHYKGTLDDGTVFDTSEGRDPLKFTVGAGQVIEGFDKAVLDMSIGDSKTVTIPAAEAYGEYEPNLMAEVPAEHIPGDLEPKTGEVLQVQTPDGHVFNALVVDVSEKGMMLDANHPLAGKALTFEITIVEIEE